MAAKDDINIKIDESLEILKDNEDENGCEEKMRLLHEDRTLNEEARAKLVSNLNDIKEAIEQKEKAKTTEKQSSSNMRENVYAGSYTESGGIMGIGKKRKVNVYMPSQTPATKAFKLDLGKLFEKMSVQCKFLLNLTELQNDAPLVVVCIVSSRLEPDIDHAMHGVIWPTRFAVIVLNTCRENLLPRLPIETRLNIKQDKYKNVEFIDAAFTPEESLYTCNMNTEARSKISDYIDAMYQK